MKKEGNLPKPLPSFSIFRPLLSLLSTTIYIKKRKIHKKNYSFRPVISTIRTPNRFLQQNFNMVLKNSLSKSNYTLKNSWEFEKIIVTKTIPDGHVMISLDVVAMFPNIPMELVKEAVSN